MDRLHLLAKTIVEIRRAECARLSGVPLDRIDSRLLAPGAYWAADAHLRASSFLTGRRLEPLSTWIEEKLSANPDSTAGELWKVVTEDPPDCVVPDEDDAGCAILIERDHSGELKSKPVTKRSFELRVNRIKQRGRP